MFNFDKTNVILVEKNRINHEKEFIEFNFSCYLTRL